MPQIHTFEQALDRATDQGKKHILLGNGFSRACRNDIFAYDRLFERAMFSGLPPTARRAFDALATQDFEVVMRALRQAARLAELYLPSNPDWAIAMLADADRLRDLLATTIASSHPDRPGDIAPERYAACRRFLSSFDDIYTLNYDLLLYWALMQTEIEPSISFDDGFRTPDDGPEEYVTWDVDKTDGQNVFYLHGALHIFDAGHELQKFTWYNTGIALIDQIRAALNTNRYPLFVAEGTHNEKMERIQHSNFLGRAYRSFAKIGGALFVFGHSMADNDEHILRLIERGKTKRLLVGLYGDPDSESNRAITTRSQRIVEKRSARNQIQLDFFDANSASVWG